MSAAARQPGSRRASGLHRGGANGPPGRPPAIALAGRYAAFLGLAIVGALTWPRMFDGAPATLMLAPLAVAALAAAALCAVSILRRRRRRAAVAVAVVAVLAGVAAAGLDMSLLVRPSGWRELLAGLGQSVSVLPGLRLPYRGTDAWTELTLNLFGAGLLIAAGLLAFWPRRDAVGRPLAALVALVLVTAIPVISLDADNPLLLGVVLAVLAGALLGLEHLRRRDLVAALGLTVVVLAVAVPVATLLDRNTPLLDYEAVAEQLAKGRPVTFDWDHAYGPIDWSRDGRVVLRVSAGDGEYWTAQHLDDFDGTRWVTGEARVDPVEILSPRPGQRQRIVVRVRDLSTTSVIGAGTTLAVIGMPRRLEPGSGTGRFTVSEPLRRGDAYRAWVDVPDPSPVELAMADPSDHLALRPFRTIRLPDDDGDPGTSVTFPAFGADDEPVPSLAGSPYERTWRLARSLSLRSTSPYQFVRRVETYLAGERFTYSERPPDHDVAPLERFLFDDGSGYCQQFSGAMALLLRMGGIPARVVAGFTPGTFNPDRGEWIVRDTDAHSWVEVWFEDIGWVRFDPTPSLAPAASRDASTVDQAPSAPAGGNDGGDEPGTDPADEPPATPDPAEPASDAAAPDTDAAAAPSDEELTGTGWWRWPAVGLLAALALAAAVLALRRLTARTASADPDARALRELQVLLMASGRPVGGGVTLAGIEAQLGDAPGAREYVRALRARRFAGQGADPGALRWRAARRELLRGRGLLARLRALWMLSRLRLH